MILLHLLFLQICFYYNFLGLFLRDIPVKLSVKHRHLLFPSFHREKQFVRHDIFPGLPV